MSGDDFYSIEELARAAGMTTRNVRAYRTKGLLPPPVRAGRASQYRSMHLLRLRDIRVLREAGLPLKLIVVAAGDGEDLGPQGRLGLLAARISAAGTSTIDVREPLDRRPVVVDVPQQRAAVRRLCEIGFAPATAQQISQQIARHGGALAAYLGETVSGQVPALDLAARAGVSDLTLHLTGVAVRKALGVTSEPSHPSRDG